MAKYTKDQLEDMKFGQLVKEASSMGIYKAGMTREGVIEAILEAEAPAEEAGELPTPPAEDAVETSQPAEEEESKEEESTEEGKEEEEKPKSKAKPKAKPKTKPKAKPKAEKKPKKEKKEKAEKKPRAKKTVEEYVQESGVKQKDIDKVLESESSHSDKIRDLFDLGVKVPRAIAALTGRHYSFVYEVLCKFRASFVFGKLLENFKAKVEGKKPSALSDTALTKLHKDQAEVHKAAYIEFGLGDNRQSDIFTDADYKRIGKNAAEKAIEKILDIPEDSPLTHKELDKFAAIFYGK